MAGNPITTTTFANYLKTTYVDDGDIETMIINSMKDPFTNAVTKDYDSFGDSVKIPVLTATNVRAGASFTVAQNMNSNQKGSTFVLTPVQIYVIASFDSPTLRASASNAKAFGSVVKQEMDLSVKALNLKIATQIHRDGSGVVSQSLTSGAINLATGAFTLINQSDVLLYEVGDQVVFSQSIGGALKTGGAGAFVCGKDYVNSALILGSSPTVAATPSTLVTSLSAGDYIYRTTGDAAAASTYVCMSGFPAWVPPPVGATSVVQALTNAFFGVIRSQNAAALAGLYYCNTASLGGKGDPYPEALSNACSFIQMNAGCLDNLDLISMNPQDFRLLNNSASTKLVALSPGKGQEDARIGSAGFGIVTDWGVIPIKQSVFTPAGFAELISTSVWTLFSSAKPGILDYDGLTVRASATADAWEARFAYTNVQLGCYAPGWNGLVQL